MRLAPSEELGSAPDEVIYDDHLRDGFVREESTMVGFSLWPTAHGALLVLGTTEGVYAFVIDAAGKRIAATNSTP